MEICYSNDAPLEDPADDALDIAPFAKNLADAIPAMFNPQGFVVAIYGEWGSGKTTLLNFIKYYIGQIPESNKPLIIDFHPWWFSGREDLIRSFFNQFAGSVSRWFGKSAECAKLLAQFADALSPVKIPIVQTVNYIADKADPTKRDVPALKEEIKRSLKQKNRRILIVIDDIDRLSSEEIRLLFMVIKDIADFPNVVYLLALDKHIVSGALDQIHGFDGTKYLEKIVQTGYDLPHPDKKLLRMILSKKIDSILEGTPKYLWDKTRWQNIYFDGIDHFVKSPRNVQRFSNALLLTYPVVKGEVNPVDFIAVEYLRLFCPSMYHFIQGSGEIFVGSVDIRLDPDPDKRIKLRLDTQLEQIPEQDRESVKKLLFRIFPKTNYYFGGASYGSDWLPGWRNSLRVCTSEHFDTYFRLSLSQGQMSQTEIQSILECIDKPEVFEQTLINLNRQKQRNGLSNLSYFLECLLDHAALDILEGAAIPSIISTFFKVGDDLLCLEDDEQRFSIYGNDDRILRIVWRLFDRLDEAKHFSLLEDAIRRGDSISLIVKLITIYGRQHGKYGTNEETDGERIISLEHLRVLEELTLEKIRQASQEGSLIDTPLLWRVLFFWKENRHDGEVRSWVEETTRNDDKLLLFLDQFISATFTQSADDVISEQHWILASKSISAFINLDELKGRVQNLIESKIDLTERQREALTNFVSGVEEPL
ncbi:KAP P-loop domain protein [Methanofollis liminatans DSM 4140]|uniref:KAP P-loop domain protein n=1 Tax=Methanofollis liminatans DSM 4140 TaxID=28892 RepID=J0S2A4_9EURY|nr:P-loop NTPase fold protein [Methanofollis liminatans]EJG08031.1 KAP P-loop domain protein [Methanofollis liminatans DSM 4140]